MLRLFVVMAITAFVLHEAANLAWPAAVFVGLLINVGIGVWGMITQPWRIKQDLEGERQRLLAAGWREEDAQLAAREYVRRKYELR